MNDHQPPPVKPRSFAEWKESHGLTDEQIAARIRERGVDVKRAMIGAILRGHRAAGNRLALALRDETGLPIELFLLAAPAVDGSSESPTVVTSIVVAAPSPLVPVVDSEVIAVEDRRPASLDGLKAVGCVFAVGFLVGLFG